MLAALPPRWFPDDVAHGDLQALQLVPPRWALNRRGRASRSAAACMTSITGQNAWGVSPETHFAQNREATMKPGQGVRVR